MRTLERFKVKSQTKDDKKGRGYATLRPNCLRGFRTGELVSIKNRRNGKQVFCRINADGDLFKNQIGIDYVLQQKLEIERSEENELEIASRSSPSYALFWMNHPDDRVRVPFIVGTVIALVSLVISLALIML
jgi:hypothetical protein